MRPDRLPGSEMDGRSVAVSILVIENEEGSGQPVLRTAK